MKRNVVYFKLASHLKLVSSSNIASRDTAATIIVYPASITIVTRNGQLVAHETTNSY